MINFEEFAQKLGQLWRYAPRERFVLVIATAFLGLSRFDIKEAVAPLKWSFLEYYSLSCLIIAVALIVYGVYKILRLAQPKTLEPMRLVSSNAEKGASAFTEADTEIFSKLGRDKIISKLQSWIIDDHCPLIAVQGESGAGKTSILRAGLCWGLKNKEVKIIYWEAIPTDAGSKLLNSVNSKLELQDDAQLGSIEEINTKLSNQQLVIIIDQFEQLNPFDHKPIFDLLEQALCSDPPYVITWIIAFRQEYAATFFNFLQLLREVEARAYERYQLLSVEYFRIEEAKTIITQLLAESNTRVESELINNLVASQAVDGKISPVDIGISVQMLNQLATQVDEDLIKWETFRQQGGETNLLINYLDQCFSLIPLTSKDDLIKALIKLIDLDSDRRVAEGRDVAELLPTADAGTKRALRATFEYLASPSSRVLEKLDDSNARFRLMHERFIPALRHHAGLFIAEVDHFRLFLDRQFQNWSINRHRSFLLSGKQLRTFNNFQSEMSWSTNAEKDEFLGFSRAAHTKKRIFGTVGAILLLVAGYFTQYQIETKNLEVSLKVQQLPHDLYKYKNQLRSLTINDIGITDIEFLKNSFWLLKLDFSDSTNLDSLYIERNKLTSLEHLPKGLTTLDMSHARGITSLEHLPASITRLNIRDTSVSTLEYLPKVSKLITLCISLGQLSSLKGLPDSVKSLKIIEKSNLLSFERTISCF